MLFRSVSQSRYDLVYYGLYGIWEVVAVTFIMTGEDTYTPQYELKQNIAADGEPDNFRYNRVPQALLTLYVPSASVVVAGTGA